MNRLEEINRLIDKIEQQLLPRLTIESVKPVDPVVVRNLPSPWKLIGAGNYAAVVSHPDFRGKVIKVYAPGRPGLEEEAEVYRKLGSHPAYSECYHSGANYLVLKRLNGMTLYDCLHRGIPIVEQVITDVDRALAFAREQGLRPNDVHAKNVMSYNGRGSLIDVSDFLETTECAKWKDFKKAYYRIYLPLISRLRLPPRLPYFVLNGIRKGYRIYKTNKRRLT